jgi:hypothetical protein
MRATHILSTLLLTAFGAACEPAPDTPLELAVLAAIDGSDAVAWRDDEEVGRCTIEGGECTLSVLGSEPVVLSIDGYHLVTCEVEASPGDPEAVHVASGYLPAEPVPYLAFDNVEGTGEQFFPDPVDIVGGCEDVEGDGELEVLLLGLDGVVRVEGSFLTKDGGGEGFIPPELSPIRLERSDGSNLWFIAL